MMSTEAKINEVIAKYDSMKLNLCVEGLDYDGSCKQKNPLTYRNFDVDRIERLLNEIPLFCVPYTRYHPTSSYGLKHLASRRIKELTQNENTYINNGSFIIAMLILGYNVKFSKTSPNAYIKCKLIQ